MGLEHGMTRGLEAEAQAFGELAMTDVSRRLVEISGGGVKASDTLF